LAAARFLSGLSRSSSSSRLSISIVLCDTHRRLTRTNLCQVVVFFAHVLKGRLKRKKKNINENERLHPGLVDGSDVCIDNQSGVRVRGRSSFIRDPQTTRLPLAKVSEYIARSSFTLCSHCATFLPHSISQVQRTRRSLWGVSHAAVV
jgi:hypothetical protein